MLALDLLKCLNVKGYLPTKEVAHRAKSTPAQVRPLLAELMKKGMVEMIGKTRGAKYRRVRGEKIEIVAFPIPIEIGNYFAIGTEFRTLAEHFYHDDARRAGASLYRHVNQFKTLGLIEVSTDRTWNQRQNHRAEQIRRKYHSITFRDDGVVIIE